ncbi:hypothetical protein SAMN05421837_102628 [Amycolatopsis pretoriensis]|uniref:Uncharacterized protein n=1 Tax=Amycolatopsis pretoriensis TaxID=218821 RepID=A0A1H5QFV4_9PSEU|nr:hypothetical protein [Amycolatopsis pretoriensis]SEF24248.1 hypothetical protein SAMN05421837_102628 [Amycolatopsis pretoriensis]
MTAECAPEALVVGLLTDDGLPGQLAGRIADGLPARLVRDLGAETAWRVEHETQSLPLDAEGDIPMLALAAERRSEHSWDLLVLITDLPRRAGTVPIVSDYNAGHGVAMVSLPALGALRLRARVTRLIVHLFRHLVARRAAKEADPPRGSSTGCGSWRRRHGTSAAAAWPTSTWLWWVCAAACGCSPG